MRGLIMAAVVTLIAIPAGAFDAPKTEDQKTLYAVGLVMARQLTVFGLAPEELEFVKQGLTDGSSDRTPLVELEAYKSKIQKLALVRRNAQGERLAVRTPEFMEKAAKEKGALKTPTGLWYLPVKEGSGARPTATDKVKVNYRGTLIDGKEFDSSYPAGKPVEFKLDQVIKCWSEGLTLMKAGGTARLICPPELAYGETGSGSIPANATLVFDLELVEVTK